MEKSEKPKAGKRAVLPDHRRGTGIDCHPMQGRGKIPICSPCFCGLRISDIVGLKWKNVFVDNGQYRLAVAMQKTKEPIYLPLQRGVEMDAGA